MYILLMFLFINLSLLNISNKLIICAMLITVCTVITNLIVNFYGKKEAICGLVICIISCCILKLKNFNITMLLSYIAILISSFSSIFIFEKINSKLSYFYIKNFISLTIALIVDTTIMCVGLLHKFPKEKCLSIYIQDLTFKFSYLLIISILLMIVSKLIRYLEKNKRKELIIKFFV